MSSVPLIPVDELTRGPRPSSPFDVAGLERELRERVSGEVRFDAGTRALYATDASNYRQVPIGVVIPRDVDDVIATMAACRRFQVPILSRTGGTSLAGQCCNVAVVIDWSKYAHGVLEINQQERWARVLPGTVCDELRDAALEASGNKLVWGPDPATHDHCGFGGMIGNNSCGAHAQMSGRTDSNIESLDILLYDGTRLTVGWMTEEDLQREAARKDRIGEIYRGLLRLREKYGELIRERYVPIPRRVSGYNLDQLLPGKDGRINVARALVGSEGTLVTILEAKCRLIDARIERVIVMLGYPDSYISADHVPEVLPFNPTAVEGLDDRLIDDIKKRGGPHRPYLTMLPEGNGWLMVELGADKKEDAVATAKEMMTKFGASSHPPTMKLFTEKEEMEKIWAVRESGLGATAFVPGEKDSWPGWEDSAVSPEKLGSYLRDLRALFDKFDYHPSIYGHFGQGCVHCSVDFDLMSEQGIRKWRAFMEQATDLCVSYGGSLSGEHGDGQSRAEFLYKMFGPELIEAFREFKSIWDPDWKMNPGKIVDPYPMDSNLRFGADYSPWEPETHFKFPQDHGSFAHAAQRCVGVGKCRRKDGTKPGDDTMCPSFMVTHEEKHTTRGRTHSLWEMLNGNVIANGWRDENVKEALDLCLSCKGCKGDCPVNVDVATYKAEFLSHYWEGRIRPRHTYAFGWIDKWARLASLAPGLVNLVTQAPGLRNLAKWAAGMPQEREVPQFAGHTFKSWFKCRKPRKQSAQKVILWADTFNNHFFPETAQAAVEVLEEVGFDVEVPMEHLCCGRPLYDYGFLDLAKQYLQRILDHLEPQIRAGIPMVVLEPSCCSVFRDELHGLMPDSELTQRLMEQTFTFSEFLVRYAQDQELPQLHRKAIVQGHCHHKAIMRMNAEEDVMKKMGLDFELLKSGCCGMAGSFGFEEEKYQVSIDIGERSLLPAVRKAGAATMVLADGFSCREQIAQETPRRALHIAEAMHIAIEEGKHGRSWNYPEQNKVAEHESGIKRARNQALLGVSAAAVTGAALWYLTRPPKKKDEEEAWQKISA